MTRSHKPKSSHYKERPRHINGGRVTREWNSTAYISGTKVDDGELFVRLEDVYDFKIDFTEAHGTHHHQTDMAVSLLDIARPAKRKGITKDFEVVQKVRNVIALEDELEGLEYLWEDDEWEQVYDETHAEGSRSYSSVLKGNET